MGADSPITLKIEYDLEPYGENLNTTQKFVDLSDTLVGFNIKFDLHWLRRYGISFSGKRIWDCQIAHFIITHQLHPYPSLNDAAEYWKLGQKVDVVEQEYWSKGIDTPDVPWDVLDVYAKQDINLTRKLYEAQQQYLSDKPKMKRLIELQCYDLLVLQEMEWNGLQYDVKESQAEADAMQVRIDEIYLDLSKLVGVTGINWNSPDQVSCVLYGGTIKLVSKELVPFHYKDGRVKEKVKNVVKEWKMPQIVVPNDKYKLKKAGYWSTSADALAEVKAKGFARTVIDLLLEASDLEKQVSTYLAGIPKLIKKMEWENDIIHGSLNQCVAITGRLSSSQPNLQNMTAAVDKLFVSQYAS